MESKTLIEQTRDTIALMGSRSEFDPANRLFPSSCLYHTFKILLYRPMLTRRVTSEGEPTPVHSYLVHCVTSATSIIAIFNMFVRSYSINYCVLSLSYTVYIAATIYLLQVQAYPDDHQARQRLDFCIRSLNEVKQYSPSKEYHLHSVFQQVFKLTISFQ
jgi:hypothetical protein